MNEEVELLANLHSHSLLNRVGLWLMPVAQLDQAADAAARLGIDAQDLRQTLLDRLPADTNFAGLSVAKLVDLFDRICEQAGASNCVLIYNLDLLMAGLSYQSRQEVWRTMRQSFPHRQRGLLMVMPDQASHLLPKPADLAAWRGSGRLAGEVAS